MTEPREPEELTIDELKERLGNPNVCLLDVREPYELEGQGFIPGSLRIPMNEVPERLDEIGKGQEIFVICFSGMRSFGVGAYLLEQGYETVFNVEGGYAAWNGDREYPEIKT